MTLSPPSPAFACAPGGREAQAPPLTARNAESPVAVVSLLLGRRRKPRHWLLATHGDPGGLAARLLGTLAEFAASAGSTQARAGDWASPDPANSTRTQTRSKAIAKAGASPRTESGPELLLQRAFSDCPVLTGPAPPIEASYRYRLSLPSGRLASASLACWRRYTPGGAWQRRCGPMGLARFLEHHGTEPKQSGDSTPALR